MDTYTLICILGTGSYQECRYSLEGEVSRPGRYAPLLEIEVLSALGSTCDSVHVLLTREAAAAHEAGFASELAARHPGVPHISHPIPLGAKREEIDEVFQTVVNIVMGTPEDTPIVVDVTHGFRSLGLVVVSALRYGAMAFERTLGSILYGAFEARDDDGVAPVFDLTALLTLDEWAAATRDFSRNYDTTGLSNLIRRSRKEIRVQKRDITDLETLGSLLRSGMPLEAGMIANGLRRSGMAERIRSLAPPAEQVSTQLTETLNTLSLTANVTAKGDIPLTASELRRQESLVENAMAQGDLGRALRLAREYLVNRVLHAQDPDAKWLLWNCRDQAYVDLRVVAKDRAASSEAWRSVQAIVEDRNALAHCGHDPDKFDLRKTAVDLAAAWESIRDQPDEFFRVPRSARREN